MSSSAAAILRASSTKLEALKLTVAPAIALRATLVKSAPAAVPRFLASIAMLPDIGVFRFKSADCWFRKRSLRRSEFHTAFSTSCGSSAGNQLLSPHADIWGLPKPQGDGSSVQRTSIANCSTRPTSRISRQAGVTRFFMSGTVVRGICRAAGRISFAAR